jgi:hypothetical protein
MKLTLGNPADQKRQLILLAVLVLVAAPLLYYQLAVVTTEVPDGASNIPVAGRPGAAPPVGALPDGLKLGALAGEPDPSGGQRDPFGFGIPPRPPAPPPPPVRVADPPPQAPPPQPTGPKPRPPIPVKFLGFAEDPSRPGKVVSLSVNGAVVMAREGDVVDGRYRLVKVGLESIVMTYLDGQGQQTIR